MKKNPLNFSNRRGFTLIELLLYVSISAVLLLVISVFLSSLLQSRIKNQTIAEVEQQGLQVMQLITQTARNADNINSPSQGGSASSISLHFLDLSKDPTIFDNNNGIIRIKEGGGAAINLTNNRVTVSSLSFQNLSRNNTPGIIRISFILSHVNPAGRNEYEYSKIFISSASLR